MGGSSAAASSGPAREFELIPPQDVEWGELLGEGSYGAVYRGKVRGTPVALKRVKTVEQVIDTTPRLPKNENTLAQLRAKVNKQLEVLKAEQVWFFFFLSFFHV